MFEPLPECVDPYLLADENVVLEGDVPVSKFTRLTDYLCDRSGVVRIELQFHKGKPGMLSIVGTAQSTLAMQCQYCLDPVEVVVDVEFDLIFADSDERCSALDEAADAVLAQGASVEIVAILEDDLILSLPMVARHGFGDCIDQLEYSQQEDISSSPFAELQRLK